MLSNRFSVDRIYLALNLFQIKDTFSCYFLFATTLRSCAQLLPVEILQSQKYDRVPLCALNL